MRPRAVIFDLDGTLYDKARLPLRVVAADWIHLFYLRADRYARKDLMGKDFGTEQAFYDALFRQMRTHIRIRVEDKWVREWFSGTYMPVIARMLKRHYRLRPWVPELFRQLREQGIRTAVFSDYSAVPEKLQALGFDPSWADVIADAPSLGGLKPSPASFLRLTERLGVPPQQCLMVGDRDDTDGAGARAVGMSFLQITGPEPPQIPMD